MEGVTSVWAGAHFGETEPADWTWGPTVQKDSRTSPSASGPERLGIGWWWVFTKRRKTWGERSLVEKVHSPFVLVKPVCPMRQQAEINLAINIYICHI